MTKCSWMWRLSILTCWRIWYLPAIKKIKLWPFILPREAGNGNCELTTRRANLWNSTTALRVVETLSTTWFAKTSWSCMKVKPDRVLCIWNFLHLIFYVWWFRKWASSKINVFRYQCTLSSTSTDEQRQFTRYWRSQLFVRWPSSFQSPHGWNGRRKVRKLDEFLLVESAILAVNRWWHEIIYWLMNIFCLHWILSGSTQSAESLPCAIFEDLPTSQRNPIRLQFRSFKNTDESRRKCLFYHQIKHRRLCLAVDGENASGLSPRRYVLEKWSIRCLLKITKWRHIHLCHLALVKQIYQSIDRESPLEETERFISLVNFILKPACVEYLCKYHGDFVRIRWSSDLIYCSTSRVGHLFFVAFTQTHNGLTTSW